MKKLVALVAMLAFFLINGVNSVEAQGTNLINGDFSSGVPDGWVIYNSSGTEVFDGYTRIYQGTGTNPFDGSNATQLAYEDLQLPSSKYLLKVDYAFASSIYTSTNEITVFSADSEGNFYSLSGEDEYQNAFTYIEITGEQNYIDSVNITFEGGYITSPEEYDYMDITSIELVSRNDIIYYDKIEIPSNFSDVNNGYPTSDPSMFTDTNLSNMSVWSERANEGGTFYHHLDRGVALDDYTFSSTSNGYRLQAPGGGRFDFYYDAYYEADAGDVIADNWASYRFPIDVHIIMVDETVDPGGGYAYPLENYYFYQWTVTENNITNRQRVEKDFGPEEYFTFVRLRYANILIDDTEVVHDGSPTGVSPNEEGQILDRYSKALERSYLLIEDEPNAASIVFAVEESSGTDLEPTEIRMGGYTLDAGKSQTVVRMFLPKDTTDIETPVTTPTDPTSPGGSADSLNNVLAALGMDTPSGNIIFVSLMLLIVNIALVGFKITGMALPIVNIAILGLFFFGLFLPFWVMMILIFILALMFIGLRGGMQQYD